MLVFYIFFSDLIMSTQREKENICIGCQKYFKHLEGPKRCIDSLELATSVSEFIGKAVTINNYLCRKCYNNYTLSLSKKRKIEAASSAPAQSSSQQSQFSTSSSQL